MSPLELSFSILQTSVNDATIKSTLHIEDDMLFFEETDNVKSFKLLVCNCRNGCIELAFRKFVEDINTILVLCDGRISPRIVNGYVDILLLEGTTDVDDLGVANVRTVLLEGEAEDDNL